MLNLKRFLTLVFPALLLSAQPSNAGARTPAQLDGEEPTLQVVVVELESEPAVAVWAAQPPSRGDGPTELSARASAVARHLATLEVEQDRFLASLRALPEPPEVLYRLQRLFNGVALRLTERQLDAVKTLPGFKAVHPLPLLEPGLVSTAPLVGAPRVWSQPGLTGREVKIGIIDTGVDYLHRAFGGSGDYTGHSFDDQIVPWTGKVVGGWDFVGDAYNGSNTAQPDGDPMDCNGHGTHVAGIAAGYGVTAGGSTYLGPWGEGLDLDSMAIGPGVAPEAQIYALKVFGCTGSTGFAPAALEWALDPNRDGNFSDRLDVVNLSLGSSFGTAGGVYATIGDNAARAGMIIVASAGNSGDTHFITGSPAAADRVISVASSVDSTSFLSQVEILGPPSVAGRYPAAEAAFGPNLARDGERRGTLAYPPGNPRGCTAYTGAAAAAIQGAVALIDRGDCTFASKVKNAQAAGAVGVLVVNNVPGEPFAMGASEADAQGVNIPSMMIALSDGDRLKAALPQGGVTAVLSAAGRGRTRLVNAAATDTISSFSSRGPRVSDLALKPDVTAPGATVFAPEARSAWAGRSLSGTSMAAPQVAGAMALLRQLHPSWSVEELKALVMNTATPDVWVSPGQSGPRHGAARAGAGRLDLPAAVASRVVAFLDDPAGPGRVGVSFGSPEVVVRQRLSRTVRVVNKGTTPTRLTLSWQPTVAQPGMSVSVSPQVVDLPAGGSASVAVLLDATAPAMGHRRGDDLSPTQSEAARAWLSELSGHLLLTPDSGPVVRLPVYAAPRRRGTVWARQAALAPAAGSGTLTLELAGQDLAGGGHPEAAVTPLEWQYQGSLGGGQGLVGLLTDYPDRPLDQAVVAFGVALPTPWVTPLLVSVAVEIDTDGDQRADWRLAATDAARAQSDSATPVDVFVSRLCRASSSTTCAPTLPLNGAAADQRDTAPFLTDVMVLYARVADLQLSSRTTINYRVTAAGATTPWLSHDLARPGVRLAGGGGAHGFLQTAHRGASVTLAYDSGRLAAVGSLGVLLIHHHNLAGWRAQGIPIAAGGCALSCDATAPELSAAGSPVRLTATVTAQGCTGPPTVSWAAGDGSPQRTGNELLHTYSTAGTYSWWLEATVGNVTCRRTGVITVVEELPRGARPVLRSGR